MMAFLKWFFHVTKQDEDDRDANQVLQRAAERLLTGHSRDVAQLEDELGGIVGGVSPYNGRERRSVNRPA